MKDYSNLELEIESDEEAIEVLEEDQEAELRQLPFVKGAAYTAGGTLAGMGGFDQAYQTQTVQNGLEALSVEPASALITSTVLGGAVGLLAYKNQLESVSEDRSDARTVNKKANLLEGYVEDSEDLIERQFDVFQEDSVLVVDEFKTNSEVVELDGEMANDLYEEALYDLNCEPYIRRAMGPEEEDLRYKVSMYDQNREEVTRSFYFLDYDDLEETSAREESDISRELEKELA